MHKSIIAAAVVAPLIWACGGGFPPPNDRLAGAQAAERSARELGAEEQPAAHLSLKLAQDQIAAAEVAIANGDNEQADSLLVRAQADAELAIALAREHGAKSDKQEAITDSAERKASNELQGAVK